VNNVDI